VDRADAAVCDGADAVGQFVMNIARRKHRPGLEHRHRFATEASRIAIALAARRGPSGAGAGCGVGPIFSDGRFAFFNVGSWTF
jgi:hypothetical protein